MKRIIDSHSHFGRDAFFPVQGKPSIYIQNAKKIGITDVIAMPVPCPKVIDDKKECILLQNIYKSDNIIEHYKVEIFNGKSQMIPHTKGTNPYRIINADLYDFVRRQNELKFYYVPLMHPYFYSIEDMVYQKNIGAKAFKIHGVAGGFEPNKIDVEFFRVMELLNIPLIIHVDNNPKCYIQQANSPEKWLNVLKNYNIKAMFTHAMRLQQESIDVINNDSRYITGLGPELLLQSDENRLLVKTDDYYKECFKRFRFDKMVFDVDYPWNIHSFKDITLDWAFLDRINSNLIDKDKLDKFFNANISNFLNLERDKQKKEYERG